MSDAELAKKLMIKYDILKSEISKQIVGQEEAIEQIIISILTGGHSLLIGVPGLAKTLLINTIAKAVDLSFNRIQFTPDLMPSDIIGTEILDENRAFKFVKGPIFSNVILADEINRTPPKTQAALLEAMQEKAITAAGQHFELSNPFFVLATQNPIEQEGTYPLPEAQLDRFMFSVYLDYPSFVDELEIVKRTTANKQIKIEKVIGKDDITDFQTLIRKIPVTDTVIEYAVSIVSKTRVNTELAGDMANKFLDWGAGPRASQNIVMAAKAHAILNGKFSPEKSDVRAVAKGILRHRIVRNYKAEAEKISEDQIIESLF